MNNRDALIKTFDRVPACGSCRSELDSRQQVKLNDVEYRALVLVAVAMARIMNIRRFLTALKQRRYKDKT